VYQPSRDGVSALDKLAYGINQPGNDFKCREYPSRSRRERELKGRGGIRTRE
jgi:hypothetical protein